MFDFLCVWRELSKGSLQAAKAETMLAYGGEGQPSQQSGFYNIYRYFPKQLVPAPSLPRRTYGSPPQRDSQILTQRRTMRRNVAVLNNNCRTPNVPNRRTHRGVRIDPLRERM